MAIPPGKQLTEQGSRANAAWRNTGVATALNVIGMALELGIIRRIPYVPVWPPLASAGVGLLLLGVLIVRRRKPSLALADLIFLVNATAVIIAIWWIGGAYAASAQPWVPFQEHKLGMVTVALLAPEIWVGVVGIAAHVGASMIQLALFPSVTREHLPLEEPWATVAFLLFAALLLVYRAKQAARERKLARALAQAEANEHLAKVLLAVRDLANTPLQTISFAAGTARATHADVAPAMDRIDRSLGKLRAIERLLRGSDECLRWTEADTSLDSVALATAAVRKQRGT
jgi:hypothetical protein